MQELCTPVCVRVCVCVCVFLFAVSRFLSSLAVAAAVAAAPSSSAWLAAPSPLHAFLLFFRLVFLFFFFVVSFPSPFSLAPGRAGWALSSRAPLGWARRLGVSSTGLSHAWEQPIRGHRLVGNSVQLKLGHRSLVK